MSRVGAPLPDLGRYGLVVFDLDGTLYRQGPVRRRMLAELLSTGGPPGRLTRLNLLRRFRQLREEVALGNPRGFDSTFARLAEQTGHNEGSLRALVTEWMERRPLRHLARARVAGVAALFDRLRAAGTTIAVWSDYPVTDKLAALSLTADHCLWAGDPHVGALKPDPAGLLHLIARTGTDRDRVLMVGDRLSHDGAAAEAANVDFLLRAARCPPVLAARQYHVADFTALAASA